MREDELTLGDAMRYFNDPEWNLMMSLVSMSSSDTLPSYSISKLTMAVTFNVIPSLCVILVL